ncbi:MAG: NAD(P)H-dependent flavin oxidoreductase [Burkholderiales bacterium]
MNAKKPFPHSLSLPLIAAPMFLISGPDMVLAACRAGIIGAFPTPNCRTSEALEEWLKIISTGYDKLKMDANGAPVGAWAPTVVTHRTNERCEKDLELLVKYKAPVVITALGSPARAVDIVHSYGGLVFADVNSMTLAKKAADCGVDGLVLVSSGAGGHTGAMAAFSFVPQVRKWWDGYIIYAGGVCDGAGIRAAEVLGADLCYMGTMFIATEESQAEAGYKKMLTECGPEDLIVTKAFTGANASMLKPTIVAAGLDPDALVPRKEMEFRGQNSNSQPWKGIWSAGQAIGNVDRVKSVAELVSEFKQQYAAVRALHG